jgi:hypothetical protein
MIACFLQPLCVTFKHETFIFQLYLLVVMLIPLSILYFVDITNTKQKRIILCLPGALKWCKNWPHWHVVDSDIHNGSAVGSKVGHTLKILNAVSTLFSSRKKVHEWQLLTCFAYLREKSGRVRSPCSSNGVEFV